MTAAINALISQIQLSLSLGGLCRINPWARENFLTRVETLAGLIFPQDETMDDFTIDMLQRAVLISQGTLKAIKVPTPNNGEIRWDLTQNRSLIEAAQDVSSGITALFEDLTQGNQVSFQSNKAQFPEKWKPFISQYQKEQRIARLWVKQQSIAAR